MKPPAGVGTGVALLLVSAGQQWELLGPPCSCHSKGAGFPATWGLESTEELSQFSLGVKLRKKEKGEGLRGGESQVSLSLLDRRRKWHPTPVSLPGKSHGQRSLVGCSPWGHKELGTTERLTLNSGQTEWAGGGSASLGQVGGERSGGSPMCLALGHKNAWHNL